MQGGSSEDNGAPEVKVGVTTIRMAQNSEGIVYPSLPLHINTKNESVNNIYIDVCI